MKTVNAQRQTIGKGNFIKYLNPSTFVQPKANRTRLDVSNIHCRSMQELDFNSNPASHSSITKQNQKFIPHNSSLFSEKDSNKPEGETGKSKSLSKFITFFENSNLLNPSQIKKEPKQTKRNNYNGFSYDLKISANSNINQNKKILKKKDKQNINYQTVNSQKQLQTINSNKSVLKGLNNNFSPKKNPNDQTQNILLAKMKQVIEEQKRRQAKYCEKINQLQTKNKELSSQNQHLLSQTQIFTKMISQYEQQIRELEVKYKEIQEKNKQLANMAKDSKSSHKESRQQDMVVKSLKKVINEQINKIIQLERFKIQNQYLKEKLCLDNDHSISESNLSNHEYSFEYEHKQEKKSHSSLSSSFKRQSQSISDYGKENFRKQKTNKIVNEVEGQSNQMLKATNFKSFFQIEQSPISADEKMKRLFKISQIEHGKKDSNKNNQNKQNCNMIKIIEAESLFKNKQNCDMIKIIEAESSFSRDAIQQVNEENEEIDSQAHSIMNKNKAKKNQKYEDQLRQAEDSILQEVDQYLTKWRNKP